MFTTAWFIQQPRRLTLIVLCSYGLWACQPASQATDSAELALIQALDLSPLPNPQWGLAEGVLQLSFCRNSSNDALLAEADELRRWRLVGEASAMPPRRQDGLLLLAEFYQQYGVLLWQQSGTVSSQFYRLVVPQGQAQQARIYDALARLGRDRRICFSAVDQGNNE